MTDKRKPEHLDDAELDGVSGGAEPMARYNFENAWPSKVTDTSDKTLKDAETSTTITKTGGGSDI